MSVQEPNHHLSSEDVALLMRRRGAVNFSKNRVRLCSKTCLTFLQKYAVPHRVGVYCCIPTENCTVIIGSPKFFYLKFYSTVDNTAVM